MTPRFTTPPLSLRQRYLGRLQHKDLTAITFNGFHLKGHLVSYDESDIIITTTLYGDPKDVLACNFVTIVPATSVRGDSLYKYNRMTDNGAVLRHKFLMKLLGKTVTAVAFNGFQLKGRLIAFDDNDLVIETDYYERIPKDVLVCNYTSIIPEE